MSDCARVVLYSGMGCQVALVLNNTTDIILFGLMCHQILNYIVLLGVKD